jgi:hypothetical protein
MPSCGSVFQVCSNRVCGPGNDNAVKDLINHAHTHTHSIHTRMHAYTHTHMCTQMHSLTETYIHTRTYVHMHMFINCPSVFALTAKLISFYYLQPGDYY